MIGIEKDITVTDEIDRGQWERFVMEHPRGNIFQSPAMFDVYGATPNYYPGVLAVKNSYGRMQGILCYNIISEPSFRHRFTARSIITGGPLVVNNNPHYTAVLLQRYCQIMNSQQVIYTQVRNLFDTSLMQTVFLNEGFEYEDHLNILIDLDQSPEELLTQMHRKRAANIRRASKKKIDIRPLSDPEEIHMACSLVQKTYSRINIPAPPRELFLNAWSIPGNKVLFLGAFSGSVLIGCRVYLVYKKMMYDWYAASDLHYSHLHPNDLLPWQAMLWGREHAISTYDFAGAGKPGKPYGVRDYKMRFGGTLHNFGRYTLVHKPWLFRLGKLGMSIYKYIHP